MLTSNKGYFALWRHLVLLFLSCWTLLAKAQNPFAGYRFENLSVEDGLSASTVFGFLQAKNGMVWIATAEGLNRYNGYQFQVYRHSESNPKTLPDNWVWCLDEDSLGYLWVGMNNGSVAKLNPVNGEVTTDKEFEAFNQERHRIQSIAVDAKGYVWVMLSSYDLIRYNGKLWQNLTHRVQGGGAINVASLSKWNGEVWLSVNKEIRSISGEDFGKPLLCEELVLGLQKEKEKLHVLTLSGRLLAYQDKRWEQVKVGGAWVENANPSSMIVDDKGHYWVGSQYTDGLTLIHQEGGGVKHVFRNDAGNEYSLCNNTIYTLMRDREGNIWVGTLSGVSVFKPLNQQLQPRMLDPTGGAGVNNVYYFYEDAQHRFWAGTLEGGLAELSGDGYVKQWYHTGNTAGLPTNSVRCVFQSSKGNFYVGVGQRGLYRLQTASRTATYIGSGEADDWMERVTIRTMVEWSKGKILLGTDEGLVYFDEDKGTMRLMDLGVGDPLVYDIKVNPHNENQVFIGCSGSGLLVYDFSNGVTEQVTRREGNAYGLSSNMVFCLMPLGKDTLLAGTYGGGLNIIDLKRKKVKVVGTGEGFSNDVIYGICKRGDELWMSTNKGLVKYHLRTGKVKNYDLLQQLQSLEYNEGAFLAGSNGVFFFGGIRGYNVFRPESIKLNTLAPGVVLLGITEGGKQVDWSASEGFRRKYFRGSLQFEYSTTGYTNAHRNQYRVKLEGFDENWVEAGLQRTATYTNLPPGSYQFKVMAANDDGVWGKEMVLVSFEILPPWWRTWWFMVLSTLAGGATLYGLVHWRTRALRRNYALQVADLELKALRSQMNPHFIFNSINSIQYYILNKNQKSAYTYLSKFAGLMRLILQNSRVNEIPLKDELDAIKAYLELERLRLDDHLDFSIEVHENLRSDKVLVPSMLIQPYIENAILHGLMPKEGDRKLEVMLKKVDTHVFCVIEDNGIGREKSRQLNATRVRRHESTGMKVTEARLEMLNRGTSKKVSVKVIDKKDLQGMPAGTRVELFVPYREGEF